MGSFLSSLVTPPPLAADDGDSAVVAVHSKAAWDQQFEAHRNASKLMVIDFSASWCGPCRFIEPAFKEMASRFTDAVFVKIDVDELGATHPRQVKASTTTHATPYIKYDRMEMEAERASNSMSRMAMATTVLLLIVLRSLVAAAADQKEPPVALPGCRDMCGNISVPYPFGIGAGCYRVDGLGNRAFQLECDDSDPSHPRLTSYGSNYSLDYFSLETSEVSIYLKATTACFNFTGGSLNSSVYRFSDENDIDVPVDIVWAVQDAADCGTARNATDFACQSRHSKCVNVLNRAGYWCQCSPGYDGNPYLDDGCTDIDECQVGGWCYGDCRNTPGNYTCQCPRGTSGNPRQQDGCRPDSPEDKFTLAFKVVTVLLLFRPPPHTQREARSPAEVLVSADQGRKEKESLAAAVMASYGRAEGVDGVDGSGKQRFLGSCHARPLQSRFPVSLILDLDQFMRAPRLRSRCSGRLRRRCGYPGVGQRPAPGRLATLSSAPWPGS